MPTKIAQKTQIENLYGKEAIYYLCLFSMSPGSTVHDKLSVNVSMARHLIILLQPRRRTRPEKKQKTITIIIIMIKPLADRVVIEPREAETKTASGLYIPDTAKEKPQQGKVIAAGPGKKDEPMEVKVGDEVLYGKYSGTEVTVDDKKYLIVRQSDILAIL